ncbi:hypothetical protein LRB11_13210 [Ectothiorhodospira haloalkaliphila]|uniref:hypothetical protein n=1 Tax=Ectothiorhodospira haloalkaliphila TaxID=421628 RepID=UPI001EE89241|nr:hypothetical protein [Ectothiorhodospira haloalkaliphila]MCG5525880.1 hypothetical protein [Ectothiorhodospira haloalkaliphila]
MDRPNTSAQRPENASVSWKMQYEDDLAEFAEALASSRFWFIVPEGQDDLAAASVLFDTETGFLYPGPKVLNEFFRDYPFLYLKSTHDEYLATLHTSTKLLWNDEASDKDYTVTKAKSHLREARYAGLSGWRLPTKNQLQSFATAPYNPHRKGREYWLAKRDGDETFRWLVAGGSCDVDAGCWTIESTSQGKIFACHLQWAESGEAKVLADIVQFDLQLVTPDGKNKFPDQHDERWRRLELESLLGQLIRDGAQLFSMHSKQRIDTKQLDVMQTIINLDHTPCRLPSLDSLQLTDPHKGLWELWGEDDDFLRRFGWVARDPARDLRDQVVAIDFGTTSTVVAVENVHGQRELLRIGVRDFFVEPQPQHFENPTVIECLDFDAFWSAWTSRAHRPALDWDHMRAAHEAQASWRDNPGDVRVLARILPRLKQWALRHEQTGPLCLTDQQGKEIELPPHTERNPVRGQMLSVSPDTPFDPIELYAWYLGMVINWRERGLYLRYVLSFPVKYPRQVKDRMLASFRRGLLRSLPETLVRYHPKVLNEFSVEELASEPAAYAASALPYLEIEPTEEGMPYAVFDFGGGTTDFDFGLYRWATPKEEDEGYERVFEHMATGGDNFLGGETLIEHLVYRVFQHNLDELRRHRIQFTKPLDAPTFPGSEAFLAPTQAAQTNTVSLAAELRPFFESENRPTLGQIQMDLLDINGQKRPCEFNVPDDELEEFLFERIGGGVRAFLHQIARLLTKFPTGTPIHVLLAGNASRGRHIKALFFEESSDGLIKEIFADHAPEFPVHPPLPMDVGNPHAPTAKTGVALGLLALVPGEGVKVVSAVHQANDGEAPFGWFVGRIRRGRLNPVLTPNVPYGEWHELGPLQQGNFALYVTQSPRAQHGMKPGDTELIKYAKRFPAASPQARLYACATAPGKVKLAAATNRDGAAGSGITEELEL